MKKWIWLFLAIYFIIAITLLICVKTRPNTLSILSREQNISRVITAETEKIGVVFALNQKDSFFSEAMNVRFVRLSDDRGEIALSAEDIVLLNEETTYQGESYYLYRFDFGFGEMILEDMELCYQNATLELQYENDLSFSFPIGNWHLIFSHLEDSGPLGFSRLYGVHSMIDGTDRLTGFVIGLEKKVDSVVSITDIDLCLTNEWALENESIWLDEAIPYDTDVPMLLNVSPETLIRPEDPGFEGEINCESDGLLFVAIGFNEASTGISQFPIRITYRFLDQNYVLLIDDFRFFSTEPFPEVEEHVIHKTDYHY